MTSARATFSPGRGRLLLAALLASLFFFSPALPASAQEACAGVTVVVDFGALASHPVVGCAAEPSSGLDALAQAGFAVTEVASIRGMVCRIDALPEADCGGSPPADAYWSYWHAEAGDAEWTYSMVGGADASPDSGDVEGWAFGDGSTPPQIAPADAAPAAPQPDEEPGGASYTWLIAVAALALIGALVLWRRRGRRA
ncbi:hypothetical protein AB0B28_22160 [Glycomyces sp. NPDC046736]|uniref:hypothetical protein n=1 Tax=Glycomyces sp. NPDC046736 TaxID=3155615 RepID=UPI0033DCFA1C